MTAALLLACGTHLGESLAFAGPPLALIAGLAVMTIRARRGDRDGGDSGVMDSSPVG